MTKNRVLLCILVALLSLAVVECGSTPLPPTPVSPLPTSTSPLATSVVGEGVQTLSLALLPVLDILPLYVAQQNGYFEQVGVKVEMIPVKSPQERDTLVQAGEAEGMLTDFDLACPF